MSNTNKKPKKWDHDALANDLAGFLENPERMVWTDMQMGPSGSSRPDVFTMQKSYSRPNPTTYEIKVSLSDFRSDVTSGKWQRYLKYSGAVIFAVPYGLISKEDLPAGCGLIVRSEKGWRTALKPTRNPVTLPQSMMLKLLIDGIQRARRPRPKEWNRYLTEKRLRTLHGQDVCFAVRDLSLARQRLQDIQTEVDRILASAKNQAERIINEAKGLREEQLEMFGEVSRALGLESPTYRVWTLKMRAEELSKRADESLVVAGVVSTLESLKVMIDRKLEKLPNPKSEDAA